MLKLSLLLLLPLLSAPASWQDCQQGPTATEQAIVLVVGNEPRTTLPEPTAPFPARTVTSANVNVYKDYVHLDFSTDSDMYRYKVTLHKKQWWGGYVKVASSGEINPNPDDYGHVHAYGTFDGKFKFKIKVKWASGESYQLERQVYFSA